MKRAIINPAWMNATYEVQIHDQHGKNMPNLTDFHAVRGNELTPDGNLIPIPKYIIEESAPNPDWVDSTPEDRRRDVFIIEEQGEIGSAGRI